MAMYSSETQSIHKKRSYQQHNTHTNTFSSVKRRKLHTLHNHKPNQTNNECYVQKENHPFNLSYNHHSFNPSKQLKQSNLSYLNTCSPFQPSPISTVFEKWNEFWDKTTEKPMSNYECFDFNSLLKSLTKDFEEEKEREEFNSLATQIENLKINLSFKQIQKIISDENEINEMVQRIKKLNIKVSDNEHNRKMVHLLEKLSTLTFDCEESKGSESESEQFDTESNDGCDIDSNECKSDTNGMDGIELVQNNGNTRNMNDIGLMNVNASNGKCDVMNDKKLKQKSIVHKCAKFMLSMVMIGAPLFYYYVN